MPEQPNHAVAQPKPNALAQRAIKPPPEGRGAGQASNRRGRACTGHQWCPPEGGGATARSAWSLGVGVIPGRGHFLSRVNASNSQLRIASTSV